MPSPDAILDGATGPDSPRAGGEQALANEAAGRAEAEASGAGAAGAEEGVFEGFGDLMPSFPERKSGAWLGLILLALGSYAGFAAIQRLRSRLREHGFIPRAMIALQTLVQVFGLVVVAVALPLAIRNHRRGLSDRRGAALLAGAWLTAHVVRWAKAIEARPAVDRGRRVNRPWGPEETRVPERHSAADFK